MYNFDTSDQKKAVKEFAEVYEKIWKKDVHDWELAQKLLIDSSKKEQVHEIKVSQNKNSSVPHSIHPTIKPTRSQAAQKIIKSKFGGSGEK